jgi:hypothetical protein
VGVQQDVPVARPGAWRQWVKPRRDEPEWAEDAGLTELVAQDARVPMRRLEPWAQRDESVSVPTEPQVWRQWARRVLGHRGRWAWPQRAHLWQRETRVPMPPERQGPPVSAAA